MGRFIPVGAVERIAQEAINVSGGDDRSAMAMLQAAYLQLACRAAIAERGPGKARGQTVQNFCSVAGRMINDRGIHLMLVEEDSSKESKITDVQNEGRKFASQMRSRFEATDLTYTSRDQSDDLEELDDDEADPPGETY